MSGGPALRVGLVCPYDLGVPGGVGTQVLGLARGLLAAGHDVEVLAPSTARPSSRRRVTGVLTVSTGRAVPVLANGSTARLGLGPGARRAARAWVEGGGFDVVHVHEPIPPGIGHAVLDACAEASGPRPAVVATVHVAMSPAPAGRSRALRLAAGPLRRRLADVAVLTAVSDHARRTVVDHLGRDPLVVPNGLDVALWQDPVVDLGDIDPAGPVVVVLGRVGEPRKGVGVVLRSWPAVRSEFPGAQLLVIGPLDRRAARSTLQGQDDGVRFLGPVDEATKVALVAAADVLVAPHLGGESFGLVLVEAMAAGTPVVAAALPAFRDVLAGAGVLVPPGDHAALGAALGRVLGDPRLAGDLARAGLGRAASFDFGAVVDLTVEVYRLAVLAPRSVAPLRRELEESLRQRAVAAARAGDLLDVVDPAAARPLVAAAAQALEGSTTRVQNRLAAVLHSLAETGRLDDPGVAAASARVRLVRAVLNDRLRSQGRTGRTVELDDGPPGPVSDATPHGAPPPGRVLAGLASRR